MATNKVRVIIPIFKVENYIERCAVSLFEQSYDDIEYIFVNDCTPDKSMLILEDVIKKYPRRKKQVKVVDHKKNGGSGKSRLSGLNVASGDYIWFVDSDDWVEKDSLIKCKDKLTKEPDILMMGYFVEQHSGPELSIMPKFTIKNILTNRISPSLWKFLIKKSLLFDNGIYPVPGINFAEDFLMISRLALVAKNVEELGDTFLYHYNCMNQNSYMNNVKKTSLENAVQAVSIVYDYFKIHGAVNQYKLPLSYMLCKRYFALFKSDPQNIHLISLRKQIEDIDTCLGNYVLRNMPFPSLVMKLARRAI